MLTITLDTWVQYRDILKQLSDKAAKEFEFILTNVLGETDYSNIPEEAVDYAYALATKYGEASAAWACEMFDAIAAASGVDIPPAEPAETASYKEVAKTVKGTAKTENPETMGAAVGRLVKKAGQNTTYQNAARYGAKIAWIPSGDTCAFCITLASRGWESVSEKYAENMDGAPVHIHSNCDCVYGVKFNDDDVKYSKKVYDPDKLYYDYKHALDPEGAVGSGKDKINALRRKFYKENKEKINEQKRSAYAKRKERESSAAEEINVG